MSAEQQNIGVNVIAELNALAKLPGAGRPFDAIHFISGHGGWWAECPTTGKGFWYRFLAEAVRSWKVTLVRSDGGVLVGMPSA